MPLNFAVLIICCSYLTANCQGSATRPDNVKETLHGVEITDPYRWLEDQNSAETRAWIDSQNKRTDAYLGGSEKHAKIAKRLEQLLRVERIGSPIARNGKYFYSRQRSTDEQAILY